MAISGIKNKNFTAGLLCNAGNILIILHLNKGGLKLN
jgi:hypothetical protein